MRSNLTKTLIIMVLILPLNGCVLASVLGSAGGWFVSNEYSKSQEKKKQAIEKKVRREERTILESQYNVSKDQKIKNELSINLLGGGLTKIMSIHTIVENGVVTLYGNVPSPKIANRAIELARRVVGVKSVVSNIVVVEYNIVPSIRQKKSLRAQPNPPQRTRQLKPQEMGRSGNSDYPTSHTKYIPKINPQKAKKPVRPKIIDESLPWKNEPEVQKPVDKRWTLPEFIRNDIYPDYKIKE